MSPVRRPSGSRAQLITTATASAQRIQDFEPEVGRRAWRSRPGLGGTVEVQVALPGIQLLLADTGDATTGETVTSWPGSDGAPRQ